MSSQQNKDWNPFSAEIWVAWLGATAVGVAGLTTFIYVNFATKESFADYKHTQDQAQEELVKRLSRIEDKVDRILEKRGR